MHDAIDPRLTRLAAIAAFAILLIWLAWTLVRGVWALIGTPEPGPQAPIATPTPAAPAATAGRSISDWHLFGHSAAPAQPQQRVQRATNTGLQLLGTLAAPDAKAGKAIITDSGGNQNFYRVGDELPGGSRLSEVHQTYVVLDVGGDPQRLELADRESVASAAPQVGIASPISTPRVGAAVTGANVDWNAIRSQLRMDPAAIARNFSVMPYMEDGKQIGVRLQSGRDNTVLRNLGLTSSDVVTAVNGQRLDDPTKYLQLVNELKNARRVTVTYRRNGKEYTRDINVPQ